MTPHNRFIVVDDDPLNNLVCNHIILKFAPDAEIKLFTIPKKHLKRFKSLGKALKKVNMCSFWM
ncbi:hypothetical protein [Dyadobacter sp. CY343]|uniref:hypothetical protein n=1 Tax=Dyadobacter sp. CY343 TaxID=2907299 RepID=UPI001F2EF9F7|nr:hypothetical protein [Dyadobacter sp. CY343]MCE7061510.1 hypothetical protein [Dyadobacter sp. CY343]